MSNPKQEEKKEEQNNESTKPNPKTEVKHFNMALTRLKNERQYFRKNHPYGCYAKPNQKDGNIDWYNWTGSFYGK